MSNTFSINAKIVCGLQVLNNKYYDMAWSKLEIRYLYLFITFHLWGRKICYLAFKRDHPMILWWEHSVIIFFFYWIDLENNKSEKIIFKSSLEKRSNFDTNLLKRLFLIVKYTIFFSRIVSFHVETTSTICIWF